METAAEEEQLPDPMAMVEGEEKSPNVIWARVFPGRVTLKARDIEPRPGPLAIGSAHIQN